MGNLTRQKLNDFYEQFKPVDVTFTKEIIHTTGLTQKEVQLKCGSDFYPCVIYSASFEKAKVVANNKSGLLDKLKETGNSLSIRFFFKRAEHDQQIVFLVPARMTSSSAYGASEDMTFFSLDFSARPPDDLIEIIGCILEANINSTKRRNEPLLITPDVMRKTGLATKEVSVVVGDHTNKCVLRELSFGGARVIAMSKTPLEIDENASITIEFEDPREQCVIEAKILKVDKVTAAQNMFIITLDYTGHVPMIYKVRLNVVLSQIKQKDDAADKSSSKKTADSTPSAQNPVDGATETPAAEQNPAGEAANVADGK
ncbi:MAG: PilZ domain-containing protein [Spirochaetaceae bacterium]|jgi:hypothetical protein|nr:PilZ domain-containing protein [Spirochaetaceae bacterium]